MLTKPFEVLSDASDTAVAAVLQQEGRPVGDLSENILYLRRNALPGPLPEGGGLWCLMGTPLMDIPLPIFNTES